MSIYKDAEQEERVNVDCSVIQDLLPLYADDACSEQSRWLVQAHMEHCPQCAAMLARMMREEVEEKEERQERFTAKRAFQKARTRLWLKWLRTAICLALCGMLLLLTIGQLGMPISPGLSYEGLWNRYCMHRIARMLQKDPDRLAYAFFDPNMIYQEHLDILERLEAPAGEEAEGGMIPVTIGQEDCYLSKAVYENEYQGYLQSGNEADFWMEMIFLNQPIIPKQAMEEILGSEKYRAKIYEKFHDEPDYSAYGDHYLEHFYTGSNLLSERYGYPEGYYYQKDYSYEEPLGIQGQLRSAVRFPWQPEGIADGQREALRETARKLSQEAVAWEEEAFVRKSKEQFQTIVWSFAEADAVIERYSVTMFSQDRACIFLTLRDGRGDPEYAELSSPENKYCLYVELKKGKIMRIFGPDTQQGKLLEQFAEERGLRINNEDHIYLANPYRDVAK